MNLKRFILLALGTYGLCALWAFTGVQGESETLLVPSVPQTVTLGMLTPQQLEDRAEELTTTTTSTSTSTSTTTQPTTTVVAVPAETHCQEWFPTAISVGWPNDPATLEKLGRLLWKETRCQNVDYKHTHAPTATITVSLKLTRFTANMLSNCLPCLWRNP